MNTKIVFCEECRNDVSYIESTVPMVGNIKEKEYHYVGKEARCADCGSELFIPELSDFNLRALYEVYRKENGIISLEQIREIPEKYSIGKRPLSLLLGWGEQTFSRYADGDMPTKQYSDILVRLYNDPAFYSELLEANKENLKSTLAYEKSRRAVDAYLEDCQERQVEPEQSYKGTFNVRISPELHRNIAIYAMEHGKSLNAAVEEAIGNLVR